MEDEYCPDCNTYGTHSDYQCKKNIEKTIEGLEDEKAKLVEEFNKITQHGTR